MSSSSMSPEVQSPPTCQQFLSVVVPVYNSSATLSELVGRLVGVLEATGSQYELILVNDGSRDGSWETIEHLARTFPSVRGLDLMRNYGQHNALLSGIRVARGNVIITLDDDLQHPPEAIPELLTALSDGRDVVYGTPRRLQHARWRNLTSSLAKTMLHGALGAETARHVSGFRAFRSELCTGFREYRGPYVSVDVLLSWATERVTSIVVEGQPRRHGTSHYTLRSLLRHASDMLTGFNTRPLQLVGLLGFGTAMLGMVVFVYVVGRFFLQGGAPAGFPFLASIIAVFAGAQLFALGIIGEYLARMHFRMMEKPTYVVRRETP